MKDYFTRWLAPPYFKGDEEKSWRASLLNGVFIVCILNIVLVITGYLIGGRIQSTVYVFGGITFVVITLLRRLLFNGKVSLAGALLIALGIVLITAGTASLGTIRTPTAIVFLLLVVIAGQLFGQKGLVLSTLSSSLAVLGLILAENAGMLPRPDYSVNITQWATYTILIGLTGVLTYYPYQSRLRVLNRRLKESAEPYQASEEYYRILFEGFPIPVFTKNREGEYTSLNAENRKYWAVNPIGRTDAELLDHETAAALREVDLHVMETGDSVTLDEYLTNTPFGNRQVLVCKAPLRDVSGKIVGILGASIDITERKQMEEALQESEEKYRDLVESSSDWIWEVNLEGVYTYASPQVETILGYKPEEIVGKIPLDLMPPEEAQQIGEIFKDLTRKGEAIVALENVNLHKDGRRIVLETNGVPFFDKAEKVAGYRGVNRDITKRKQYEREREILVSDLEHRSMLLQAAVNVSKSAIAILSPEALLQQTVELIQERFNYYYAGIFLVDHEKEFAVLQAGTGKAGKQMLAAEHKLAVGGESMIGWSMAHAEACIALDVGEEAVRFDNPYLPKTRSEMALPLVVHGEAIGGLTVQSVEEAAFKEEDIAVLQTMADQLAIAIQNARLYDKAQKEIAERVQAEAKLKLQSAALESAANGIVITDREGNISWVNPAFTRLTGYSAEEAIGQTPRILKSGVQDESYFRHIWDTILAGEVWSGKLINRRKDGTLYTEEQTITPVKGIAGEISHFIAIKRDVTERVQMEQALQESEARFKQIADAIDEVFTISDLKSWAVLYASPAFENIWGRSVQELYEDYKIWGAGIHPDDRRRIKEDWLRIVEQGGRFEEEHRVIHTDGSMRWVRSEHYPVRDESGQVYRIVGVVHDITKRVEAELELKRVNDHLGIQLTEIKKLEANLREQAIRDPLTGVFNRRYMNEMLIQEFSRASRKGEPLSVVILDLDHLKKINDTYGHVTGGDKALQALADTLEQMCRTEDTFCRYGGDEFLIILHNTPAQVAYERALQWRDAIARIKITSNDMEFGIAFSAGVAEFPTHSSTNEEIIQHADQALYRAKELGRNQVVVYQNGKDNEDKPSPSSI